MKKYLKTESYDKEWKKEKEKKKKPLHHIMWSFRKVTEENLPFHLEVPLGQVDQVSLGFPREKKEMINCIRN